MIKARFYKSDGKIKGFSISGHAGYADRGQDVVCAAVTSAAQLAANIITDGFAIDADAAASGNEMHCIVGSTDERSAVVLDMLAQQLAFILEEFPGTIKISFSEV